MRAVTGSVVSSKAISLSKAAAVLSRFSANENAARPEVAAYVRRASAGFDDLVRFHREIRAACKHSELEKPFAEAGKEEGRKKKNRKRSRDESEVGDDGNSRVGVGRIGEVASLANGDINIGSDGERKKNKRKKDDEERTDLPIKEEKNLVSDGNLVEQVRHYGDGTELREDGKRRKKKMKVHEVETSNLGRKVEQFSEVEEERHHHRKKKEKEKRKGDQEEEILVEVLDQKRSKHLDVGEGLVELKDQRERHKKKKKNNIIEN